MQRLKKTICKLLVAGFLLTAGVSSVSGSAEAASGTWKHNKNGYWYEYSDGTYPKNQWLQIGKKWYHFDARGFMQTGWQKIGGKWYYFGPNTGAMQTGWKTIGKKTYFFKADGSMAANEYCQGYWLNKDGTWTKKAKASWKESSKGWWFGDSSGWYAKKQWLTIDGKSYYFDNNGYLLTNQWIGKYCVDATGAWKPNASKEWVKGYIEKVKYFEEGVKNGTIEGASSNGLRCYYALCYLDADSTPDLLMDFSREWTEEYYVTYFDQSVVMGSFGNNEITGYIPRKGLIKSEMHNSRHFFDSVRIYRLYRGKTDLIEGGAYKYNDYFDYDPNYVPYWTWNDKKVTEEQYYKEIDRVFDKSKCEKVQYCSYDEILKQLNSYLD